MCDISVMPVSTFCCTYPRNIFYKDENGLFHHDSSKTTVFGDVENVFHDNYSSRATVDSSTCDLKFWKTTFTEKPVVFLVNISREDPTYGECRSIGVFVVLVHTNNASLQSQIEEAFGRCEDIQNRRKKFSLKISCRHILRKWLERRFPDSANRYVIEGGSVTLSSWQTRCADCQSHPFLLGGCLPVAILYGIPYLIYRGVKHRTLSLELETSEVSSTDASGVNSSPCMGCSDDEAQYCSTSTMSLQNCDFFSENPPAYESLSISQLPTYEAAIEIH